MTGVQTCALPISIGRAIFVIATAQAEYGITSDVVGNNPFASIILAIVAISVIFVNIEFYKSQEKLEEIVTKLNNKDKGEKSSSDNLEQEGKILIYNDIEEK